MCRNFCQYFMLAAILLASNVWFFSLSQAAAERRSVEPSKAKISAEDVVKRYLQLDAEGAQLTYAGRLKLSNLTVFPADTDQATYTTKVISGYRIISSQINGNRAKVIVEFDGVGTAAEDFYAFREERKRSRSTIGLKKIGEEPWKIETNVIPHVDWRVAVEYLEKRKAAAFNPKPYALVLSQIVEGEKKPLE